MVRACRQHVIATYSTRTRLRPRSSDPGRGPLSEVLFQIEVLPLINTFMFTVWSVLHISSK